MATTIQVNLPKSLPLTEAEQAINAKRAAQGFEPYIRVRCGHPECKAVSPFRSVDELAVARWTVYTKRAKAILCPKHMRRA